MKRIPLTQGKFALVDDDMFDYLNQWKWYLWKRRSPHWSDYAMRTSYENGKQKTILMHREIMNPPNDMQIDHRNHNGLDNQKINLRVCAGKGNQHNQSIVKTRGTSQFKGVHWDKDKKKWRANISYKGKNIKLGYFDDEVEAAEMYNRKAKELFGEFACLNKIA